MFFWINSVFFLGSSQLPSCRRSGAVSEGKHQLQFFLLICSRHQFFFFNRVQKEPGSIWSQIRIFSCTPLTSAVTKFSLSHLVMTHCHCVSNYTCEWGWPVDPSWALLMKDKRHGFRSSYYLWTREAAYVSCVTVARWGEWERVVQLLHTLRNTSSDRRAQPSSPRRCFLVRCHYTIKRKPSGNRLSTTSCLLLWRLPHFFFFFFFCSCRFPHNFELISYRRAERGRPNKEAGVLGVSTAGRSDTQRAPCNPDIWQPSTFESWMDMASALQTAALQLVGVPTKCVKAGNTSWFYRNCSNRQLQVGETWGPFNRLKLLPLSFLFLTFR